MYSCKVLIEKVRELVAKSPNNVYSKEGNTEGNGCSYNQGLCLDKSEGCIMGQALRLMGINTSNLKDYLMAELPKMDFEYSNNQLSWLHSVQMRQDIGKTWLEAMQYADLHYPGV